MKKNTRDYLLIISLLLITSVFSLGLFLKQKTSHDRLDMRAFPYTLGDWKGQDIEVTEREYKILETRNLISREYVNSSGDRIYTFIIYSETNRAVFHPPEVCLIGSGVTITDKRSEKINFDKRDFLTNKLYLEKGNAREMALYCYRAGNIYTDNFYFQQIYLIMNQVFARRVPGATIRVSMFIKQDEETTLSTLKSFLKEIIHGFELSTKLNTVQ